MNRWWRALLGTTVVAMGAVGIGGGAVATPPLLPDGVVRAENGVVHMSPNVPDFVTTLLEPGDVVSNGSTTLEIPAPGIGVASEAMVADESETVPGMAVEVSEEGAVSVYADGEPPNPNEPSTQAAAACNDEEYHINNQAWNTTYSWGFKGSSTPSYLATGTTGDTLVEAVKNMINVRNDCNLGNSTTATQNYEGSQENTPNVTSSGCGARDEQNMVGFKPLNGTTLGRACWWWNGNNAIIEADFALDDDGSTWYNSEPENCSGKYAIESVATHEFGHMHGMLHVGEPEHGKQTMSTYSEGFCQNSEATLGKGDRKGFRILY